MTQPNHGRVLSPLLQQGLKFLQAGDAVGAELLLDTYITRNAGDPDGHNLAALAKHALGRMPEAISHLEKAIELNPREPLFVVNLAGMLIEARRSGDALRVIDEFLIRVPGQLDVLIQRVNLLHRLSRFEEATSVARMAVAFHRDAARSHHALGLALIKEGNYAEAADAFSAAVERDPEAADSWTNRGVALKEIGKLEEAEDSYRRVLALAPRDPIAANNLANVLGALGRTEDAIALYREAVALEPDYADAKANLGAALRDAGRVEEALTGLAQAVAQHPGHTGLLNAYGNALRQAERFDEAIDVLKQAIAILPTYAEAHNNLGLAYALKNMLREAATHLKQAAALKPEAAVISNNYGALLLRLFRFPEAVAALSNAVARDPTYDEALINLGVAHYMRGGPEAQAVYRRVLERRPDNAFARYSLGVALLEDQKLTEAEAEIRRALELDPTNAMALNTLGVLLLEQHFITEARKAMREAADVNTRSAPVFYSNYAFASLYEPDLTNAEILEIHKEYGRRYSTDAPDIGNPHINVRDPERRLRIAYLSPDFRAHSVSYFFEALLEKHNRERFEICLYSDTSRTDTITDAMRKAADLWVESAGLTNDAFAQRLRDDGIDILVNLGGHTSGNRLPVCALNPAPVQIEYLGYPETSGVPAMDYRLTDGRADPIGEAEKWCTEEIVRLPDCFHLYRPSGKAPPPGPAPHIARGYVTFASFNVLPKVTDRAIAAWAQILKAVPNSRFFIKCKQMRDERVQARVRADFARHGIDPVRIDMLSFVPSVREHLDKYAGVDLALDTFPYNGTTTTCEALYMGVPVLSLAGDNHRSRVGLSLLTAVGIADEFIASSVEDYVARAIAFGRAPGRLAEVRSRLRPAMETSPLRDEVGFTRTLEETYRSLWRRWCQGPQTYAFKSPPELRNEDSIQGVLVKTL